MGDNIKETVSCPIRGFSPAEFPSSNMNLFNSESQNSSSQIDEKETVGNNCLSSKDTNSFALPNPSVLPKKLEEGQGTKDDLPNPDLHNGHNNPDAINIAPSGKSLGELLQDSEDLPDTVLMDSKDYPGPKESEDNSEKDTETRDSASMDQENTNTESSQKNEDNSEEDNKGVGVQEDSMSQDFFADDKEDVKQPSSDSVADEKNDYSNSNSNDNQDSQFSEGFDLHLSETQTFLPPNEKPDNTQAVSESEDEGNANEESNDKAPDTNDTNEEKVATDVETSNESSTNGLSIQDAPDSKVSDNSNLDSNKESEQDLDREENSKESEEIDRPDVESSESASKSVGDTEESLSNGEVGKAEDQETEKAEEKPASDETQDSDEKQESDDKSEPMETAPVEDPEEVKEENQSEEPPKADGQEKMDEEDSSDDKKESAEESKVDENNLDDMKEKEETKVKDDVAEKEEEPVEKEGEPAEKEEEPADDSKAKSKPAPKRPQRGGRRQAKKVETKEEEADKKEEAMEVEEEEKEEEKAVPESSCSCQPACHGRIERISEHLNSACSQLDDFIKLKRRDENKALKSFLDMLKEIHSISKNKQISGATKISEHVLIPEETPQKRKASKRKSSDVDPPLKETPRKRTSAEPKKEERSTKKSEKKSNVDFKDLKGLAVFAKWPNSGWYYPGMVEELTSSDWKDASNVTVKFYDGLVREMKNINILPAHLIPSGSMVCDLEDETEMVVLSCDGSNTNSVDFKLSTKNSNEEVEMNFNKLAIRANHMKTIKQQLEPTTDVNPKKMHMVSLDNLISGRRSRGRSKKDLDTEEATPPSKVERRSTTSTPSTPARKATPRRARN